LSPGKRGGTDKKLLGLKETLEELRRLDEKGEIKEKDRMMVMQIIHQAFTREMEKEE
jgi:hypothetical protein